MKKQNTQGCLLFNISKQSVNPGKNFGPYGLPKTALLSLWPAFLTAYENVISDKKTLTTTRAKFKGLMEKFKSFQIVVDDVKHTIQFLKDDSQGVLKLKVDDTILKAATITISVSIMNITFLSTFKALNKDLFKSDQV